MIVVPDLVLSGSDEAYALEVARGRDEFARRRGYRPILPGSTTASHALGARGELAAARYYGVEWRDPVRQDFARMHDPDVGNFDVRTTEHRTGRLPVRPKRDLVDRAFLLVIALGDRAYRMAGWFWGHEAARPEFWVPGDRRGPGWYLVPQTELHDPGTLPS